MLACSVKSKATHATNGSYHAGRIDFELINFLHSIVEMFPLGIEVSEGSEFDCVVLYIDVLNNCVEVTLNPQLVTAVRKRLDRNKSDSANQVG